MGVDDGRGGNVCGRGPGERPLPHAPALPSSGGTSLRLSAGLPRARARSLPCPPASRCALRPGRGGGARFCRRRHLAVPRGRLLVLPALLPAPGTCPWPLRNGGRGLGGRGCVVTFPRALGSALETGALGLAQVRPSPARVVGRREGRRAAARRALDAAPGENHPSARAPSIHLPGRAGWSPPSVLAEGVATCLPAPLMSRLSGPGGAGEPEEPRKSSGSDLAGGVGGDPGARLEGPASAPGWAVVGG